MTAIVLAAGTSRRMGFDKLTIPLAGQPLLIHTLHAFEKSTYVSRIVLVCTRSKEDEFRYLAKKYKVKKLDTFTFGGSKRQDSVWNGILAVGDTTEYVAVHDGARPLVTQSLIAQCMHSANRYDGVCAAEPLTDTVHKADSRKLLIKSMERKWMWRMQTPQVFLRKSLLEAFLPIMREGYYATDEASILLRLGKRVVVEESMDWNFKITVPRDLILAEAVLAYRKSG